MMDKVEMPDGALNIIESGHLILRNTHTKTWSRSSLCMNLNE